MISANIDNKTRKAVYGRDGYCCALCDDNRTIQVHHVVPRGQGGTNSMHNLITLCAQCHAWCHGHNIWIDFPKDEIPTPEEMEQYCIEYLSDYYAPDWNPWSKTPYNL